MVYALAHHRTLPIAYRRYQIDWCKQRRQSSTHTLTQITYEKARTHSCESVVFYWVYDKKKVMGEVKILLGNNINRDCNTNLYDIKNIYIYILKRFVLLHHSPFSSHQFSSDYTTDKETGSDTLLLDWTRLVLF